MVSSGSGNANLLHRGQPDTEAEIKDVYGLSQQEMEVDSDVNEDANRESLLDASLISFVEKTRSE